MNEVAYTAYIKVSKEADELHKLIFDIATEEGWFKGVPENCISPSRVHAYAKMKGIITAEELNLLRQFYMR